MKDLYSKVSVVIALAPVVLSATDTGSAIDLQGFKSAVLVMNTGAIVGSGDFTTKIQESDTTTGGDFTDVDSGDLIGSFPTSLAAASVVKVGYRGTKRYVRQVTTKNSGTSIAVGIVCVKGHPTDAPAV